MNIISNLVSLASSTIGMVLLALVIAAIVGSIADAIWGIPPSIESKALAYLPDIMKRIVFQIKQ